jgi:hypothetical protein
MSVMTNYTRSSFVNSLKLSRRLLRSSTEKAAEVLYRADL